MKNLILIYGIIILFFAASCKKDESISTGVPKAGNVSTSKDLTTFITKGNMGDWIAIQGENLNQPTEIKFNDILVDLKQIYTENNIIYIQVPVKMPIEVTNKIIVKTNNGEITYPFEVNIPDLELTGMFNEYTKPGDTIKIYGKFLELYEVNSSTTKISFDGIETPVIFSNDVYLTAKVPQGVKSNIKLKAVNSKYNVSAICKGFYQDKNNMITSFDSDFPYTSSTGKQWIGNGPTPKPISDNYIRFEVDQTKYPDGLGWFYLMENSHTYDLDMLKNPSKYELKFELNMNVPIQKTKFFIYYYWAIDPIAIGSEYFTVQTLNNWQTVTIPLDKIIPEGHTGTSTNYSLNFRVENFAPVERVAMYMDNLRIYKKGD